jgi:tripartite-type tricarboxylate transporter receptor subunit TctC
MNKTTLNRRQATQAVLGTLMLGGMAGARAQATPQMVRLVVPFNPGGGSDQLARILQPRLTELLKTTIIIENRPGAGGVLGAVAVAKGAPDALMLLLADSSVATIAPTLYPKMYANVSLAPVTSLAEFPQVLVASTANVKANSLTELIAQQKASGKPLSIANAGTGTSPHLTAELLGLATGLQLTHVAYKGGGPALTDLAGGQVDLNFTSYANVAQMLTGGRLKVIAVTSPKRVPELPNVQTVLEAGYPAVEVATGQCVFAPGGTPRDVVAKINAAIVEALRKPDVIEKMKAVGLDAYGNTPDEFTAWINKDLRRWAKVIQDANVKVE